MNNQPYGMPSLRPLREANSATRQMFHTPYKIVSVTFNAFQIPQPSNTRQLFTIQLLAHHHNIVLYLGVLPSEVLQPLFSLCCSSSLEQTPKRPPSICSSS